MKTSRAILGRSLLLMGVLLIVLIAGACRKGPEPATPTGAATVVATGTPAGPAAPTETPPATPPVTPAEATAVLPQVIFGSGNVVREERPVSGFDRVSLEGLGDAFITQREGEALTVEADDNLMPYIQTEVRDGTLILGMTDAVQNRDVRPSRPIRFHVGMERVAGLDVLGGGDMEASSLVAGDLEIVQQGVGDLIIHSLVAEELDVRQKGAGEIFIDVLTAREVRVYVGGSDDVHIGRITADELLVIIGGGGDAELAGQVVEQSVFLFGAGDYLAGWLRSETATVEAAGACHATIWVTDALHVRITGPITVEYYGNPQLTQHVSRLGRLVRLGPR